MLSVPYYSVLVLLSKYYVPCSCSQVTIKLLSFLTLSVLFYITHIHTHPPHYIVSTYSTTLIIFHTSPCALQTNNDQRLPSQLMHTTTNDQSHLTCGVININANKSAHYDSKIQHPDFTSIARGVDIIGITETHLASEQDVQKEGYHHYAIVRKKASLARSHSGGIAVLVTNSLAPYMTMCDWSNPCCLAIKIKAATISLHQDLYVLTVYLPPEHSSYLKSTNMDLFLLLANAFSKIPQEAPVVIMGDFNAHTNNQSGALPRYPPRCPFPIRHRVPPYRSS